MSGNHNRSVKQYKIQEYDKDGTDKSKLFPNNRENKIRMIFREEVQLALRPFKSPCPKNPPLPIDILDWMTW